MNYVIDSIINDNFLFFTWNTGASKQKKKTAKIEALLDSQAMCIAADLAMDFLSAIKLSRTVSGPCVAKPTMQATLHHIAQTVLRITHVIIWILRQTHVQW